MDKLLKRTKSPLRLQQSGERTPPDSEQQKSLNYGFPQLRILFASTRALPWGKFMGLARRLIPRQNTLNKETSLLPPVNIEAEEF